MQPINEQLVPIINAVNGTIGVFAQHVETGKQFALNADQRFLMASVYKIPIAVYGLHLVEQGKLDLEKIISIEYADLVTGSGILHKHFIYPGVALSIHNLLRLMLTLSDNSATDIFLNQVGGPTAVNQFLKAKGFTEIEVSSTCLQTLLKQAGVIEAFGITKCTVEEFEKLEKSVPVDISQKAAREFAQETLRNTTTPQQMSKLLLQIQQHIILSQQSSKFLIGIMQQCKTGTNRIRALLPPTVKVADKTGTISGIANDVAIIELPEKAGNLILSIFVKADKPLPELERAIAEIAQILVASFTGCQPALA